MKTVEDVAAELSDAKVFGVLDATSGFGTLILTRIDQNS